MAKSSTRRVIIYINGKEVEASVKQIRAEMNRLINEQNRMAIGSDEYSNGMTFGCQVRIELLIMPSENDQQDTRKQAALICQSKNAERTSSNP